MVVLGNRLPAAAKPGAPKPLNLPSKQSENGNGACPGRRPSPLLALPIPLSSPPAGHMDGVTGEPTGGEGGAPAPKDPNESAWGVDLAADAAAQRELAEREEAERAYAERSGGGGVPDYAANLSAAERERIAREASWAAAERKRLEKPHVASSLKARFEEGVFDESMDDGYDGDETTRDGGLFGSKKSAADRALDQYIPDEVEERVAARTRPAARRTEWGADDDGDLPSLAELPPRAEPSVYEIEKRNAFQRELEAAQEDTRRREELRREAELRLRQRQAAPVDRVRSVDARLGGKGYAVAPAARDDGRGERLSGGSSAAQSAAATAAALGLLPVANGDGYGGRPRMQEAPPRRDLGRDELRPLPGLAGARPGGEVSRQAASDMSDVDIKAKMRELAERRRAEREREMQDEATAQQQQLTGAAAKLRELELRRQQRDGGAAAGARRAAAARRRASRRGARAPRRRRRAPRRAPRPPRRRRRGTTATRGMASAATRPAATSGAAIAPPAAPSVTRAVRGTRSVTPAARAPSIRERRRTAAARPTLRRSRLSARCTTTTLGSAPTSCQRGGARRSTA